MAMASAITGAYCPKVQKPEVVRQLADFPPTIWADHFASFSSDTKNSEFEAYAEEIKELKEDVRVMLVDETISSIDKVEIIDSINRLGLSYHFANEIDAQITKLFDDHLNYDEIDSCDLYTVSLQFRVFRQHGFKMSCDVFNKFKDKRSGKFPADAASDARGLLSLYEASQLRIRGEDILDEALAFTTSHLEKMVQQQQLDPLMLKQVTQALTQPLHKRMPRMEARLYMSTYETKKSHHHSLLKLSKIDYNYLQKIYQQELSIASKWWKDLGFKEKVPYGRDRIAEGYFWISGTYIEPQYSLGRIIQTQLISLLTVTDDTYDAFGTLDELKIFTDAVSKWDISGIDLLPDPMQYFCRTLLKTYDEIEEQMSKEGRAYSVQHGRKEMQRVVRGYYQEAEWLKSGHKPPYDEYMETATITGSQPMMLSFAYVGMGSDIAPIEAFDWLEKRPKIVTALDTFARLIDDVQSSKFEQKRGHIPSAIECYVKQYGVSEKEAIDALREKIENLWKDINEECLKPTQVSMDLLMPALNLARTMDVIYKYGDGFTNPELLQDFIKLLFVDPVPL